MTDNNENHSSSKMTFWNLVLVVGCLVFFSNMTEADSITLGIHDVYEYLRVRVIIGGCVLGSTIIICCCGVCAAMSDSTAPAKLLKIFWYLMVFACFIAGTIFTYILVCKNRDVALFHLVAKDNGIAVLGQIIAIVSIIMDYAFTAVVAFPIFVMVTSTVISFFYKKVKSFFCNKKGMDSDKGVPFLEEEEDLENGQG